ncbi:MAG: BACON domain-containing protein [Alistipes sp.]|nr:BACON domain-containing protein [Alistipes sp.]
MSKFYIYISVLMLVTIVGCSKQPAEIIYPEPDYANVQLSSSSAVVEREGGVREIFVSTNRASWSVETSSEWVDLSIEGNSLRLFVDENTTSSLRMAVIEVVAGEAPDLCVARFKLTQLGDSCLDLSAEATANCYITPTQSDVKFRADVKGNGHNDGNSRYMATYGAKIEGASYADVVWEATFDGDKTRSVRIIDSTPIYADGYIYLRTGDVEGNALVAVYDGGGKLLWSWHLWVTDAEMSLSAANGIEWMDRNLGALNNDMNSISNRGMLYQWGRKEPFLPSPVAYVEMPTHSYDEDYNLTESEEEYAAIQQEIERLRVEVNINSFQTGDGEYEWQYAGFAAPVALNAPGNIEYALEHPTTFLACRSDIPIGEYLFDWYMQQDLMNTSGLMMQSESQLWGDADQGTTYKTIFDPCPVGYCVPPRGAFGEIPAEYACTYLSDDWTKEAYGWRWSGGNGDFFPAVGNYDVSGLIGETSEKMLYWTAESFGNGASGFGKAATLFVAFNDIYYGIYPLLDATVAGSWYSYGARSYGASVRCVREESVK